MVTTKQVVQAKMAIQKFCAMAEGKCGRCAIQPPLPSATVRPWVSAAAPVPANQPGESAVAGGALPEHAQQEGGEQRRVDEAEDQLQQVHDVVVAACAR